MKRETVDKIRAALAARRAVAQAVAPWRRENETLRSNCDHLSSENASLSSQVDSMAMRIESLAEELAKPEDVRLREVLDALDGRAVIFDGLGARVTHLLDEMDEWIARAGEAERRLEDADAKLTAVRVALTEAGVPEVEPYPEEHVTDHERSLRTGGRVIGAVARIERLVARLAAAVGHVGVVYPAAERCRLCGAADRSRCGHFVGGGAG